MVKEKREQYWGIVAQAFNANRPGKEWPLRKLQDLRRRILQKGQDVPDALRYSCNTL